jgi:hypothetical protein
LALAISLITRWLANPALDPQIICQSSAAATLVLAVVDR